MESVFLARHGETLWNTLGRRQGRLDSPLTDRGLAQARRSASALVGRGIDAVFSSPLGRALTTATLIGERLGLAVTVVDDLAEVDHGEFAGLTSEDITLRHPLALARRRLDKYNRPFPGGESYADADCRAGLALASVRRAGAERPLLVSHEMIGRMLLKQLLGLGPREALKCSHPNDVVYEVDPVRRLVRAVR